MLRLLARALIALLTLGSTIVALPKVSRTGKYLYTEDGNRFFIKGIAYQTQIADNLADGAACARDLPFLQKLGVNAIRAYSASSSLDHDECMSALSNAGIYVMQVFAISLAPPSEHTLNGSIDTTLPTWSTNILDQYLRTIDAFEKYDNVLAYNVGNEVVKPSATQAAPFVLAAARDVRAYLNSIGSSALVGYASIDGSSTFVQDIAGFFACDRSGDTASIDLFGLNNYEWCGNAPNTTFDKLNQEFGDYPVAAYFSEFGSENCNPNPRVWTEIPVMFSTPMSNVWSGGLAFSYFPHHDGNTGHEFGMITVSADNASITTNADFDNLAEQYGAVTLPATPAKASVPPSTLPACPTGWNVSATLPPTPDDAACGCLADALSCVFVPPTADYTVLVGELLGIACGLAAGAGGSCANISADGASGTYGRVAMCDPTIRLSYVMSQYYELEHGLSTACSFSGNATVNTGPDAGRGGSAGAAASCIASAAVFTPSAPPVLTPGAGASNSKASSGAGSGLGGSSSGSVRSGVHVWAGMSAVVGCVIGGMLWTLGG
ncbi:1,3-beta-glucanosyltransferase, partial [Mycena pura]